MTATVHSTDGFGQEIATTQRRARLEKALITLLIFIGICGFTVVTLEASSNPVDFNTAAAEPIGTSVVYLAQR